MNEHTKHKADLERLLREADGVKKLLEHDAKRALTDDEIKAMAMGAPPTPPPKAPDPFARALEDDEPPGGPLESELEDDDEDGLDYDELGDTCPRSSKG